MAQLLDDRAYSHRDTRQVFVFSEDLVTVYRTSGVPEVRAVLEAWVACLPENSFAPDLQAWLQSAQIFTVPRWKDRIVLKLPHKVARDEVCVVLNVSPLRRQEALTSRVFAKLTASQMQNKKVIWDFFCSVETRHLPVEQRQWRAGYKLVLSANSVLVYTIGHSSAFCIDFALSPTTVNDLCYQALLREPGNPASESILRKYKLKKLSERVG